MLLGLEWEMVRARIKNVQVIPRLIRRLTKEGRIMPYTQTLSMSADNQHLLLEWWNVTESAKVVVRHLVSLVSELRLHPKSGHADGIILFYLIYKEI